MIKFVNKDLKEIPRLGKDTDMTIEKAISKGYPVPIWEENDGDGNILTVNIHYGGFLISIEGDNYESMISEAYTATWLDFKMIEEMKEEMETYKYLIDEETYSD